MPTLETLLNSALRPTYWTRNFENSRYDLQKIGWVYTESSSPGGTQVYDTTRPGYGNQGHTFGDVLSEPERQALLEYLKTL